MGKDVGRLTALTTQSCLPYCTWYFWLGHRQNRESCPSPIGWDGCTEPHHVLWISRSDGTDLSQRSWRSFRSHDTSCLVLRGWSRNTLEKKPVSVRLWRDKIDRTRINFVYVTWFVAARWLIVLFCSVSFISLWEDLCPLTLKIMWWKHEAWDI